MGDLIESLRNPGRSNKGLHVLADEAADALEQKDAEIARLREALERLDRRAAEIISEHIGGRNGSYIAQELGAIAREALQEQTDD